MLKDANIKTRKEPGSPMGLSSLYLPVVPTPRPFDLFIFWSHDMTHRISVPKPGIEPVPDAVEAQSPVRIGRPGNSHTLF